MEQALCSSAINCKAILFGQDGQGLTCMLHFTVSHVVAVETGLSSLCCEELATAVPTQAIVCMQTSPARVRCKATAVQYASKLDVQ